LNDCVRITACRLCDSADLDLIVSFAPTPPGDQYLKEPKPQTCYPLDLMRCRDCGAVQLADTVNPSLIYPEYLYTTSVSRLDEHFKAYAARAIERLQLRPHRFVLDIGSNDGTLLRAFAARGHYVAGVDPAVAIATGATAEGLPTYCGFFSKSFAQQILDTDGPADLVTANHVFANIAELNDFTEGVKILLAPDGTFIFETGYWPAIVAHRLIDTIEHEHIHYFAVAPLARFFQRHGLQLVAVEEHPTKGGSLRGYVQHAGRPMLDDSVAQFTAWEAGVTRLLPAWVDGLSALRHELDARITAKPANARWVGYGAAVGSTLLLHHFGFGSVLSELWDDNPTRHGRFSPGFHLPVVAPNTSQPDTIVLLAWRYADLIMKQHPEHAGKWLIPLPTLRDA
jgi:SAM-dependent methyltransferase